MAGVTIFGSRKVRAMRHALPSSSGRFTRTSCSESCDSVLRSAMTIAGRRGALAMRRMGLWAGTSSSLHARMISG